MKLAVTGGKGGTGKSMVATALAVELAKNHKVLLADLDVDCPDDHLLLSIEREKEKDVMLEVPKLIPEKCIKCGRCAEVCRENAILFQKEKGPSFMLEQCTACTACMIACPVGAIGKKSICAGKIYLGSGYGVDFISGELEPGQKESSPVVNATKEVIARKEKEYDFIIVDTAAGTHCSVIAALRGCSVALPVAEPTPMGSHDLGLILELLSELKIPAEGVLNKEGIGDRKLAEDVFKKHHVGICSEIPYKREIAERYSKGIPINDESIRKLAEKVQGWKK